MILFDILIKLWGIFCKRPLNRNNDRGGKEMLGGLRGHILSCCAVCLISATRSNGQTTTINGSDLVIHSTIGASGTDYLLNRDGFAGTYITLAAPGSVTLTVDASGATTDSTLPNMDISVDDFSASYAVTGGFNNYSTTVNLPAGTHFIRTDFNNQQFVNGGTATLNRTLALRTLQITDNSVPGNNVTVQNQSTDALALGAADNYIANYRKGPAKVMLPGVAPGAQVQVDMRKLDFNFGGGIAQSGSQLSSNANLNSFVTKNFNMLVPENAGKWASEEPTQGNVNTSQDASILSFAAANNMDARQHNLIWSPNPISGGQQPTFAQNLITSAASGNNLAANTLRTDISNRINYYVQGPKYSEVDVYNESLNNGQLSTSNNTYWNIYGPSGIASIYNEMNQKLAAAGQNARTYTNDYNILQNGGGAFGGSYIQNIESIENGDNDPNNGTVGGIGVEYYVLPGHSATRIFQTLQNLSSLNLPISLTEFGENSNIGAGSATAQQIMNETMRLFFGNPKATSFVIWGWSSNLTDATESGSVLVDGTYTNLTTMGKLWEDMLGIQDFDGDPNDGWSTHLTATVGADGTINFNGYYGDYALTINGQVYDLNLLKGITQYTVPEPASGLLNGISLLSLAAFIGYRRGRMHAAEA
jgi:GH35 family endo-1,4-beta-xylanase